MRLIDESNNPAAGYLDSLSDDRRMVVQVFITIILDYFEGGDWPGARKIWEERELDNDETVACWNSFDSRQRAYLKRDDRKYLQDA